MRSCIYEGRVAHRRTHPHEHAFEYRMALVAIDLDELGGGRDETSAPRLERFGLFCFRRRDFLGDPSVPLADAVRERVSTELDVVPGGRIVLVTQARALGYLFNPVSFYYCFDADDALCAIVAEITNTPWKERHSYVLDARERAGSDVMEWTFAKAFHVSPFYGMDQTYVWRFTSASEQLRVSMLNLEGGSVVFSASLNLTRRPWTNWNLARLIWRYPAQPLRMHLAIYWQAARLWWKRTPFFTHPKKRVATSDASST
jgi:uncharacterized protein